MRHTLAADLSADLSTDTSADLSNAGRWEWQQFDLYLFWFKDWEILLVGNGYATTGCTYDKEGNLISRITIKDDQLRRILNIDETQVPLNTDRSDTPSTWVMIDKSLPDPGEKTTKSSIHITALCGTNASVCAEEV